MKKISPIMIVVIPMILIVGGVAMFAIEHMAGYKGITRLGNAIKNWPILLALVMLIALIPLHYLYIKKNLTNKQYWMVEGGISLMLLLAFLLVFYISKGPRYHAILPNDFKGTATFIYGVKGYPEVPQNRLFPVKIIFPRNGIFITSTYWSPPFKKIKYQNGKQLENIKFDKDHWECVSEIRPTRTRKINFYSVTVEEDESELTNTLIELCKKIN